MCVFLSLFGECLIFGGAPAVCLSSSRHCSLERGRKGRKEEEKRGGGRLPRSPFFPPFLLYFRTLGF